MDPASPASLIIAAGAGLISFVSPCVLPLFPSYLAFITGTPLQELRDEAAHAGLRRRILVNALGFIAGFSIVFMALGASASLIGQLLLEYRQPLQKVGGLLVILFGLSIAGVIRVPALMREWRLMPSRSPGGGFAGSTGVGFSFALGWTPCIGPILGSILVLAGTGNSVSGGSLLLGAYALGLGVPFFLSALAVGRFLRFFGRFKRWLGLVNAVAGGLLVLVGVLIFSGYLTVLNGYLIGLTPQWLWKLL